jgi:hypothetical protein
MQGVVMIRNIAAAMLATGVLVGFAPVAGATESEYIADLESEGFTGPAAAAVSMGYQVCTDVANGVAQGDTIEAIYENTGDDITRNDAQYVYEAAVLYLCA